MLNCEICKKEYNNHKALGIHISKTHNILAKEYYDNYLKKENEGICSICCKFTNFINLKHGYRYYCSVQCQSKSDYNKNKIKETNLKRYGVEIPSKSKEIKEKIKNTNLLRYGVEYPTQCNEIKEKIKDRNIEHYGVENVFQNEKIKEKIKNTNILRYGVEYASQAKEIKEKVKQTCLNHYGVKNPLQNKEIKEKVKQTNIEYYGVENPIQSVKIKEKIKLETIEKYRKEFSFLNIIDYNINNSIMTCYCNECKSNYNIKLMLLRSRLKYLKYKNPCINCFPINSFYSNQEKELVNYIKSIYNGNITENDRSVLNNKELDIFLPNLKLAFEYNGLYWHSSEYKDKNYHLNKTIECEKQNIQLIHIFENEWIENQTEIKKYIKDLINDNININDYPKIFLKENNKIIVDRKYNNGKLLHSLNYKLIKNIEPNIESVNDFNIYNCGYLEYYK